MSITARGQSYPGGPYSFCDNAGVHPQPCACASPLTMPIGESPAAGQFMHALLNPEPAPGPPYTHTFVPPEPIGWDEDGNPIYPEPGPAFAVTEQQ